MGARISVHKKGGLLLRLLRTAKMTRMACVTNAGIGRTPEGLFGNTAFQEGFSEKALGRVLGKASQKGSEEGGCYGFYSEKGF